MASNELEVGAPVKVKTREVGGSIGVNTYRVRGGKGTIVAILTAKDGVTRLYEVAYVPSGRKTIVGRDDLVATRRKRPSK